jgi:hypothetical protein
LLGGSGFPADRILDALDELGHVETTLRAQPRECVLGLRLDGGARQRQQAWKEITGPWTDPDSWTPKGPAQ